MESNTMKEVHVLVTYLQVSSDILPAHQISFVMKLVNWNTAKVTV